eukprot:366212-Chlamydomonas_euryale.AAC.15
MCALCPLNVFGFSWPWSVRREGHVSNGPDRPGRCVEKVFEHPVGVAVRSRQHAHNKHKVLVR